jgi:peptidyl-tRNA hydrolase, PTH1 family
LIVVHDELELMPGQLKVKSGSASPKGHNGLKSINGLLKGTEYTRIGVGIGRPESREPDVVAGYVLRKMSTQERMKIEACVGKVEMELRRLREG